LTRPAPPLDAYLRREMLNPHSVFLELQGHAIHECSNIGKMYLRNSSSACGLGRADGIDGPNMSVMYSRQFIA